MRLIGILAAGLLATVSCRTYLPEEEIDPFMRELDVGLKPYQRQALRRLGVFIPAPLPPPPKRFQPRQKRQRPNRAQRRGK